MRTTTSTFVLAGALIAAALPAAARDQKAGAVLKAARESLGGEEKLAALTTIVARGTHRRTMGEMQANGETEITLSLPDKYLRSQTDQVFGNSITFETGFESQEPVQRSNSVGGGPNVVFRTGAPGGPGGPDADPAAMKAAQLRAQRADCARLLLGWLATAPAFIEATYTYAGVAESPDGRADVIDVKGKDAFAAKLFIDRATHRPLMVIYTGAQTVMRVMRRGGGPRAGEAAASEAMPPGPPPLVEMQMFFDDYRKVGDVWLAYHITRSVNGETNEEIQFDKIQVK